MTAYLGTHCCIPECPLRSFKRKSVLCVSRCLCVPVFLAVDYVFSVSLTPRSLCRRDSRIYFFKPSLVGRRSGDRRLFGRWVQIRRPWAVVAPSLGRSLSLPLSNVKETHRQHNVNCLKLLRTVARKKKMAKYVSLRRGFLLGQQ